MRLHKHLPPIELQYLRKQENIILIIEPSLDFYRYLSCLEKISVFFSFFLSFFFSIKSIILPACLVLEVNASSILSVCLSLGSTLLKCRLVNIESVFIGSSLVSSRAKKEKAYKHLHSYVNRDFNRISLKLIMC